MMKPREAVTVEIAEAGNADSENSKEGSEEISYPEDSKNVARDWGDSDLLGSWLAYSDIEFDEKEEPETVSRYDEKLPTAWHQSLREMMNGRKISNIEAVFRASAEASFRSGDFEKAISYLEDCIDKVGDVHRTRMYEMMIFSCAALGKYEEIRRIWLSKFLEMRSNFSHYECPFHLVVLSAAIAFLEGEEEMGLRSFNAYEKFRSLKEDSEEVNVWDVPHLQAHILGQVLIELGNKYPGGFNRLHAIVAKLTSHEDAYRLCELCIAWHGDSN